MRTLIVANWKSYKTTSEAKNWLYQLKMQEVESSSSKEVMLAPSFTLLPYVHSFIEANDMKISVGAQNVSPFAQGAYTGEVAAGQLSEFASFVVIGHSERRSYFSENETMLFNKVKQALQVNLQVIFCVQGKEAQVPDGVKIVAYEPVEAIGTGHPDSPEDAQNVAEEVKNRYKSVETVLYGGSVTADTVRNFTELSDISGVLVGKASLDAKAFIEIINNS